MAEEEGFVRPKLLIPLKLLIFQLAKLTKLAPKHGFVSFDLQTRYSSSAIWRTAPSPSRPSKSRPRIAKAIASSTYPNIRGRTWD
jgi:hypothetical protein